MKVTKEQIIDGIVSYVENELIPVVEDKPTQIIASVAVKAIRANKALVDSVFEKPLVKSLLEADSEGYYEINGLFEAFTESIKLYGPLPIEIPSIPIISPDVKILTFKESDIEEIKRRIERSKSNG